jgi:small-conductance mechanosensitive channel
LPADGVPAKLVLTVLAISTINAVLAGLNAVMRAGVFAADLMSRTPGLMLDLVRLFLVLIASAFVASDIWAVDLGSLLAALGVGSVVIGLALQDTLSGLFAGVSLMSGRQFKEGDWIEFGEASGRIVRMDWRSVTVETLDDERLMVIPNSELSRGVFTVLSSSTRVFGQNLNVAFSYASPPARVMDAIDRAVQAVDLILADPPHDIDLMETADHGIVYEVTIHTSTREAGEEATTEFLRKLWYICAREGLDFAGSTNRRYRNPGAPTLPMSDIVQALAATGIFLPDAPGFEDLAASARPLLFDDGERLIQTGQPFRQFYLVVSGLLAATRSDPARHRTLQHFGPGEFLASRVFLTGGPSPIDLIAEGETMTIALQTVQVIDFLNRNPGLARLFEQAIDTTESGLSLIQPAQVA